MAASIAPLPHWDLTAYFSDLDAPALEDAFAGASRHCEDLAAWFDRHQIDRRNDAVVDAGTVLALDATLVQLNNLLAELRLLGAYVQSFVDTDARNTQAQARRSDLQQLYLQATLLQRRFQAWIGSLDVEALITESDQAREHAYTLRRAAQQASHMMPPPEEALAAELNLTGAGAWSRLYGSIVARIVVSVEGMDTPLPISAGRHLAQHRDRAVRRGAYQAELAAWEQHAEPIAAALNGIKGEVAALSVRRGWGSPLDAALFDAAIDRPTLDAMLGAARASFPAFQRYLQAKARILGLPNLAWYDLAAPVGAARVDWTFEEAQQLILEQFGSYAPGLRDLARRAFTEHWIDAEPRLGKRDGAYCMLVHGGDSRILANFAPTFEAVSTLAHELGHAYHNLQLASRTMLQRAIPMTLAETASTFCETILRHAALERAGDAERLALLDSTLQGECVIVVDITSRFLFEERLFQARRRRELSVPELNELMLQAQRDTYAGGLDPAALHPYMWAAKPHYYRSELSFYNFPYMFGLLFGLGLYARYVQDPERFRAQYDSLLGASGMADAATLASRFGIDTRAQEFWERSLAIVISDIDNFEALAASV